MGFKQFNEVVQHLFVEDVHSLSPSAGKLLLVIAGKCDDSGTWYSSMATLTKMANIGDIKTTKSAVKEIEALDNPKVMSHTQRTPGGKNYYLIHPLCPSGCQDKKHRQDQGANYPLPSGEITPYPEEKSTQGIGEQNPQHIEKDRNLKEKRDVRPLCFDCEAVEYPEGLVHQFTCKTYRRLVGSIAWEITKNENSANWLEMTETDKQLAHLRSLAKMNLRDDTKAQARQAIEAKFEITFTQSLMNKANSAEVNAEWVAWLKSIHTPETFKTIGDYAYLRALHYSRQGLPVPSLAELSLHPKNDPYPDKIAPGCELAPGQ